MADIEITIALPEELLQDAEAMAARRQISLSQLVMAGLRELIARHHEYEAAQQRSMARMERGLNLGTQGRITGSRDELHER